MADLTIPPGYEPVNNGLAVPEGYSPVEGSWVANALTGLQAGVGNLLGLPHAIGQLAAQSQGPIGQFPSRLTQGLAQSQVPEWLTSNTPSAESINQSLYSGPLSQRLNQAVGLPQPQPYVPQTPEGRVGQAVLSNVVPSLVGGGGLPGLVAREAAGAGGSLGSELYSQARPGDYWGRLAAGLMGALGGGGLASTGTRLAFGTPASRTALGLAKTPYAATDPAEEINALTQSRDAAVNAIPPGLSAQQAGEQFRSNLQAAMDQRLATRAAGGEMFAPLSTSTTRVNLTPTIDYATGLAAQNAGEVGNAYKAALGQFKSGSGLTLDTPQFAQSVISGLGDLAGSYQRGSAAQRAVLDVKSNLENQLSSQVPELAAARSAWAENSRPLDVFSSKPFAQVLATDRFGRTYQMSNDAVVSSFLNGKGSADSLDALNRVFEDPRASSRALSDYLAGQVQQKAILPNGTVDPKALQRTLQPYQTALIRFPDVKAQFDTLPAAQAALDRKTAYANLYNDFSGGDVPVGQAAMAKAMPTVRQAYTPEQATAIGRVNDVLDRLSSQGPKAASGKEGGITGLVIGSVLSPLIEHHLAGMGSMGPGVGMVLGGVTEKLRSIGSAQFADTLSQLRKQSLLDPVFASNLLEKAAPGTSGFEASMNYIQKRLGSITPMTTTLEGQQTPGPSYTLPPG